MLFIIGCKQDEYQTEDNILNGSFYFFISDFLVSAVGKVLFSCGKLHIFILDC